MVAPVRSRATMTGICSADRPRLAALPPRLRDALGRSRRLPLKDSRMKVSSASTIPDRRGGLSRLSADRKPMSPPERGGVDHLAAFRGLRDRLAGDQRLRLVRPAILVMQAGQRRPGQRVECLPAARAAVPRLAASLAPGTNVIPTAVRTAKARNPTPPDLRQQVFLRRGIVRLRGRERGRNSSLIRPHGGIDRVSRRVDRIVRFGQRQFPERLCALRRVQKPNPAKPNRKRRCVHLTQPSKPDPTLSSLNRLRNKSECNCPIYTITEFLRHGWPELTYCGRSRPRPWTPQLGGDRASRGRLGKDRSPRDSRHSIAGAT